VSAHYIYIFLVSAGLIGTKMGIFYVDHLKQPTQKNIYFYRSFKTDDTKNKSLFLMSIGIIDRHRETNLGVTINYFSSNAEW
jgi:hypothetical protein